MTTAYPQGAPEVSSISRGAPDIRSATLEDAWRAVAVCPTGALSFGMHATAGALSLGLDKCIFCGLCAEAAASIRMTTRCELAATCKKDLTTTVHYNIGPDGKGTIRSVNESPAEIQAAGELLQAQINRVLGRSLHIREVDAGSCNGCEIEIGGLNSPVYDVERFGIHFVASPRHADMLLVTGPVTRNMELALRKTYDAMPGPRLVVAVGACGCSGGIFGERNYASLGGVDNVIPVDVYIPGCPPNPHALLYGILKAVGRIGGIGGK